MKNVFEKNNSEIINCLNKLDKDYDDMSNVLSTPNSNKIIPTFQEYVREKKQYVNDKDNYFKNVLNTIVNEYNNFLDETEESVNGGR